MQIIACSIKQNIRHDTGNTSLNISLNSGLILKIRPNASRHLKNLCKLGLRLKFGLRTKSDLFYQVTQWLLTQQVQQGALHQSLDGRKGTSKKHYTLSIPTSAINNRLLIKQSNNPLHRGRFIRPTRYKPPVSFSQIME